MATLAGLIVTLATLALRTGTLAMPTLAAETLVAETATCHRATQQAPPPSRCRRLCPRSTWPTRAMQPSKHRQNVQACDNITIFSQVWQPNVERRWPTPSAPPDATLALQCATHKYFAEVLHWPWIWHACNTWHDENNAILLCFCGNDSINCNCNIAQNQGQEHFLPLTANSSTFANRLIMFLLAPQVL